jgi:peptide-methionine (S)-S-oxide reductase
MSWSLRETLPVAAVGAMFLGLAASVWPSLPSPAGEANVVLEAPKLDAAPREAPQTVVLAGGCFWGIQAVYQHTKGVTQAVSGYAGGSKESAKYQLVGMGLTGHAESVQVTYDPKQITLGKLLQIFFSVAHDPTQLNRQGPDVGPQYRTAIFFADDEQKRVAESYIAQLDKSGVFKRPIVTKLEALGGFYAAEDYHQDYATLHPYQPYIVINDAPKVEHLERLFPEHFLEEPVLVGAPSNPRG